MDQNKGHDTVSGKAERSEKQNEVKEEQIKSQQRIQEKQKKVQELKQTVDIIKVCEKNRLVTWSETQQRYSDHPERFDSWIQVLCKESVCGRCYWERSGDVDISVSYKEIRRKGRGNECLFGFNSQSWSLRCSSSFVFFCHNDIQTELRGPSSARIGVYVDHSAGTLSFYGVSDTMRFLHRVQTTFTQPLYAGFWIWSNNSSVRFCERK
ncbi:uncharacterized protein LOC125145952, partial [Tachysurus ichikawai]